MKEMDPIRGKLSKQELESVYDHIIIESEKQAPLPEPRKKIGGINIIPYIKKYLVPGDKMYSLNLGEVIFRGIVENNPIRQRALEHYPDKMRTEYLRDHTYTSIRMETADGNAVYFNSDGSINNQGVCLLFPIEFKDKLGLPEWNHSMFQNKKTEAVKEKKVRRI